MRNYLFVSVLALSAACTTPWNGTGSSKAGSPNSLGFTSQELQSLPVLILEHDDTVITESTLIVIPEGLVIEDQNGDGVIHIASDRIAVAFAPGSILRGASPDTPLDSLSGTGIRMDGHKYVLLKNLDVRGFHVGLHASNSEWLWLADSNFEQISADRLLSTPSADAQQDWLWPFDNDEGQWRENYGAAIAIEDSSFVDIEGVTVRRAQNGILLSRVSDSEVLDCDASYLSGWGLAMWRSSDNGILGSNFDYCVRGYNHGVGYRGQASAGILATEQCSRNRFIGNSATHSGNGFLGFAGSEAVGTVGQRDPDWYQNRGCNNNVFEGNDFSYSAANGLQLTFSSNNVIRRNIFRGNAISGISADYSRGTRIEDNLFEANGTEGYGLQSGGPQGYVVESGGINIDHSRNTTIESNRFGHNACGVHLWKLDDEFADGPWGIANNLEATGNLLTGNLFFEDEVAIHLRGDVELQAAGNRMDSVGEERRIEGDATWREVPVEPSREGFESIQMTEWGPWDGTTALLVQEGPSSRGDVWQLHGVAERPTVRTLPAGQPADFRVRWFTTNESGIALREGHHRFRVEPRNPDSSERGLMPYRVDLLGAGAEPVAQARGVMQNFFWSLRQFQSPCDPLEDLDTWRAGMERAPVTLHLGHLNLDFAGGGPLTFGNFGLETIDFFGTHATAEVHIPAGTWRLKTRSDDGIRVRVWNLDEHLDQSPDAAPTAWPETWIEDWTQHEVAADEKLFHVKRGATFRFDVEHFELTGYALLDVDFEWVSDSIGSN
jgi:parallel beta-helix repeat protein